MYECPNCAANLRYHIQKKMLYCDSCETSLDPYSFHKEKDAEESHDYEVTVFSCPQCGGEIISEDTTAATFCSFCGSSTILDSRLSRERCPKYIIPFAKTKGNCETAYKKMMAKAYFAPDELKNPKHIEKFRGIYMPYWIYSFEKKGPLHMKGAQIRRRGDYVYANHYDVDTEIDVRYEGISYDASSTFSDSLSSAIAPFDITKGKPFSPSFLSGFYADTSDVDGIVYEDLAENMFRNDCAATIEKTKEFSKYGVGKKVEHPVPPLLNPDVKSADLALFPVWFLSYRKGDRVAYAVVNGQTGKAVADLPVDIRKFLLGALVIALPIFLILNLLPVIKPGAMLLLSALLAGICAVICAVQIGRILKRDSLQDDRGMLVVAKAKKTSGAYLLKLIKPIIAICLAFFIYILNPVEDMIYYASSIICLVTIGLVMIDILKMHNLLTTRKLPQLGRRGGDENA